MAKKEVIIVFSIYLLILGLGDASGEEENVYLRFRDASTDRDIDSGFLTINILNNRIINGFITEKGILINIDKGRYYAEFILDDLSTKGNDYYNKDSIVVDGNLTRIVYLYPVGTIRGIVKDKLDNLVAYARLKFECSGPVIIEYPNTTDEFGTFIVEYIPKSHCRILVGYKELVSVANIDINKGSLNDIEIKLDKSIVSIEKNNNYLWSVIFGLIFISILIVIILRKFFFGGKKFSHAQNNKKSISTESKEKVITLKDNPEIKLGSRARDIFQTLKDKEKMLVEFMIKEKGETTQAKIYYGTGIPKVTLHRYIKSLESKRVIEVKKIGKVNNIKLSEWFSGENSPEL